VNVSQLKLKSEKFDDDDDDGDYNNNKHQALHTKYHATKLLQTETDSK